MKQLVLASGSAYRAALLKRLGVNFVVAEPKVDEAQVSSSGPEDIAMELAHRKAVAVADRFANALIVGSDQVACCDGRVLGKPGSKERAIEQLSLANGGRIDFYTGLCLFDSAAAEYQLDCVAFSVQLRRLSRDQIERYLDIDRPFDCAGSFKWEQLGIALFSQMEGPDVTALQGLPLIRLVSMLELKGVSVL